MKKLLAFAITCIPLFVNAQADECTKTAFTIAHAGLPFPKIKTNTVEELFTWRASVCEQPPTGPGDVLSLCQAETKDGRSVFYWKKKQSAGFITCQLH